MATKTTKQDIRNALAAAAAEGRIHASYYSYTPDSRGTRHVISGAGIERTYYRRELVAFLESGKDLYTYEYPEVETRFTIGCTPDPYRRYFVEYEDARVSPYYKTRAGAVRAALAKETEYAQHDA